ncbi:MAG: adenylate/guanylate cyclase domain-containing protein [Alphaproteobacteria bacterium]|nr:adenylate/guanylate cyclase domain-containing protein [Alphaproteobacteria bacterium]
MNIPETKYADADGIQVAYQVHGEGQDTLIIVPGLISHVEMIQEMPGFNSFLGSLTEFFKVIIFDKRGQGLSDRSAEVPGPEQRMDDISAIAEAENLATFNLFGISEGAAIAILYAASFPDKVQKVSVFGGFSRFSNCDDYQFMYEASEFEQTVEHWGKGSFGYAVCPDMMPEIRPLFARFERACATPNAVRMMLETNISLDIRAVLPEIKTPVLVVHRRDDKTVPVANGRYLADNLPNADYVEFARGGHAPWFGDYQAVAEAIIQFMQATSLLEPEKKREDRSLATILFTDIVGSSEQLAAIGDEKWRQILDNHDRIAELAVAERRGRLIKNTGDGLLATFDGPVRAIKCAQGLLNDVQAIGVKIRCGLHIGEIEIRGADITGIAVHVAARVMDLAGADQILITRTVADLIAGSGLATTDYGEHELKGIAGDWRLLEVR